VALSDICGGFDLATPQQAAQLLLERRAIRKDLTSWCRHCGFEPAKHHQLLIKKLEAIAKGELDRLAIFMPPGSAKSTYSSVLFPPWYFAQHPGDSVIAASHTAELAEKWGRRVRNLIAENERLLGVGLASASQAAGRWETNRSGEYFAAGVGGSIAGWRGDFIVIDDPVRSREDADSGSIREKTWDWFRSDVYPRLKPGGRIALIQTRWHEDDLAGRILEEMKTGGDMWEVISLPAIAEDNDALGRIPGAALWPEWENLAELERKRRAIGPRDWNALFQQRPAPEQGDYFKAEWLKSVAVIPDKKWLRIYGGSDYAVTEGGGDYTVHIVLGLDYEEKLYLLEVWRQQASSDKWVEGFCDLVKRWNPIGWAEEQGQIRSGIGPYLDRRQRERKAYVFRETFPTRGDKSVRAQSIRGRMALDGLYVYEHAPWFADFRAELLSFPAGAHDDQVDALGLVGQLLDIMVTGDKPAPPPPKKIDTGYTSYEGPQAADWVSF
jgi:predicted phage terminase large subunit-like protein